MVYQRKDHFSWIRYELKLPSETFRSTDFTSLAVDHGNYGITALWTCLFERCVKTIVYTVFVCMHMRQSNQTMKCRVDLTSAKGNYQVILKLVFPR